MTEALDIEQPDVLVAWLRARGALEPGEQPAVTVLGGGVSSRTVRVRSTERDWILKQPLVKLRVPVDWFSEPTRAHREAEALRWMQSLAPGAAPVLVFEDRDEHVVAMTTVPEPHENWKDLLLAGEVDPTHFVRFAEILATVHVRSGERLDELRTPFGDDTFFRTLRLEPYFGYTAQQVPAAASFLDDLCRDLEAVDATLVHGDFSPKNVLVRRDAELTVVDFEVAHLGDPAFDLAFSLAHMLSKARHLPSARSSLLAAAGTYWATYDARSRGAPWRAGVELRAARQTLGCLLARVEGRSQLEYLDASEKAGQKAAVLALLDDLPTTVPALIDAWGATL